MILDVLVERQHHVVAVDGVDVLLYATGNRPPVRIALAEQHARFAGEHRVIALLYAGKSLAIDADEPEHLARKLTRRVHPP